MPDVGFKHSKESIEKIRLALQGKNNPMYGKTHSEEARMKISQTHLGRKPSEEHKEKLRLANLGKKHRPESIIKCSESKLGSKNPMWKGDDVGYTPLHLWVRNRLPKPELCEYCNKVPPLDLANITGEYTRDFNNWKWYCRRCHMKSDGRSIKVLKNLKQYR